MKLNGNVSKDKLFTGRVWLDRTFGNSPGVEVITKPPHILNRTKAGLYETGTENLIYPWNKLIEDQIISVSSGGALTSKWVATNEPNSNSDKLAGDLLFPNDGSVKSVPKYGMGGFKELTAVIIGNGVTTLEDYAFYQCSKLTDVTIPPSMTAINWAFAGCPVRNVYISSMAAWLKADHPASTKLLERDNAKLYLNGKVVEHLIVPSGVSKISDFCFYGYKRLKKATITYGVEEIGTRAFEGSGIAEINLPASITYVWTGIFQDCVNLTSATIDGGLTELSSGMFQGCTSLVSVTIPTSVTKFWGAVFYGCTKLKSIVYKGTKAQWNRIQLGEKWRTNSGIVEIVCTDGTITL